MKKTYSIRLEKVDFEKARQRFGSAVLYRCFNAVCRGLILAPDKIMFQLLGSFIKDDEVISVADIYKSKE